jgi:hypothetical protein
MNKRHCFSEQHLYRDIVSKETYTSTIRADPTVMIVGSLDRKIADKMDDFWFDGAILPCTARDGLISSDSEICRMFHDIEETELVLKEDLHSPFAECEPDAPHISSSLPPFSKTTKNKKQHEEKTVELGPAPSTDLSLPEDFQPSSYSVIVGKGREAKDNVGNRRLRVLASTYLPKYADASNNKRTKSKIVSSLVNIIYDESPVGAFIRLGRDGRWCRVSESVAREKVGYTFRELLGENYKSSSIAKAAMRSRASKL